MSNFPVCTNGSQNQELQSVLFNVQEKMYGRNVGLVGPPTYPMQFLKPVYGHTNSKGEHSIDKAPRKTIMLGAADDSRGGNDGGGYDPNASGAGGGRHGPGQGGKSPYGAGGPGGYGAGGNNPPGYGAGGNNPSGYGGANPNAGKNQNTAPTLKSGAYNCHRCKNNIQGGWMELDNKYYHEDCLTCFECRKSLFDQSCLIDPQNSEIVCDNCYYKEKCGYCHKSVASGVTACGKVYCHGHLFCARCNTSLGGSYCVGDGKPMCKKCASS